MKNYLTAILFTIALIFSAKSIFAANLSSEASPVRAKLDSLLLVRGFCIALPTPDRMDEFINFIETELAPRAVNTLVLRVEYNYKWKSRPELIDTLALSKREIKRLLKVCEKHNIKMIPLIDLLGHQSGRGGLNKLLSTYPQFEETPLELSNDPARLPMNGFNMRSYCPNHPEVHNVVFDVVDEICDVFNSDTFHAGMDEVFDIGNDRCPRCAGKDKAELFAQEVWTIRNHLASKGRKMWLWGDRLLDGRTIGLGRWEGSYNNTHRAIDMIPKDVTVCDWHYERADVTAALFAMKGIDVMTCPWRNPQAAVLQVEDMVRFRKNTAKVMQPRFKGVMHTVWSNVGTFLDGFYGKTTNNTQGDQTPWEAFRRMYDRIALLPQE